MLFLTLLLSGCQSAFSWPWPERERTDANDVTPLSLLIWPEGDALSLLQGQIDAFEAAHPGFQVELQISPDPLADLRRATPQQPLDVVIIDAFAFPTLAADGLVLPLPTEAGSDDFYPRLIDAFRHEDTLYCLPREVRTLTLVYAADDFADLGQTVPRTWDELRQRAASLTEPNSGRFGLIVAPDLSRWLPFLYGSGGALTGADGALTLDTPQALAALEFYIDLFRANVAGQPAESNSSWAGEVMGKGKGSMALEGTWVVPYFAAEFPDFKYGVASIPAGPSGRGSVAFTSCYAVAATSPHAEAAFALATFLSSRAAQEARLGLTGFMPPRLSLRQAWLAAFPSLAPFMDAVDTATVWQLPANSDALLRTFNRRMLDLFAADIEPADLLREVQQVGQLLDK